MKKILSSFFVGVGMLGMAWAAVDWDKDFVARFVASMHIVFEEMTGSKIKEGKEVDFAHAYFESADVRMEPVMQKWMGALCERMQKYIVDNDLSIVLDDGVPGCEELADTDFLQIKCDTINKCLIIANMKAAVGIAAEQDKRAQALIDEKNDHQRIKEAIVRNMVFGNSCLFNRAMYMETNKSIGVPKFDCTPDNDVCVVNQMIGDDLYSACCFVKYEKDNFKVDIEKNYDAIETRVSSSQAAVQVRPGQRYYPAKREVKISDFDENCRPVVSVEVEKSEKTPDENDTEEVRTGEKPVFLRLFDR